MKNPSQQFVQKLEQNLRIAYENQYIGEKAKSQWYLNRFYKFVIPAISGALVLVILVYANSQLTIRGEHQDNGVQEETFVAFNEGD